MKAIRCIPSMMIVGTIKYNRMAVRTLGMPRELASDVRFVGISISRRNRC
jgi:hypothetical protein